MDGKARQFYCHWAVLVRVSQPLTEAFLQAITNNDINSIVKYVQRKNDCNLHTGIMPPLTIAAAAGFSELCHVLIKGGAKVNYAVPSVQHTTIITCAFCNHTDAHIPKATSNSYECQRCHEVRFPPNHERCTLPPFATAARWRVPPPSSLPLHLKLCPVTSLFLSPLFCTPCPPSHELGVRSITPARIADRHLTCTQRGLPRDPKPYAVHTLNPEA